MDFYKRVAHVCQWIPYGKVVTYGQIALLCGKPGNARQVGYALNKNLAGNDLPAHRVVNSQGFLSGAAAFSGKNTQKKLLAKEGVKVSSDLRVDLKKYGWQNTLNDALLLRSIFEKEDI